MRKYEIQLSSKNGPIDVFLIQDVQPIGVTDASTTGGLALPSNAASNTSVTSNNHSIMNNGSSTAENHYTNGCTSITSNLSATNNPSMHDPGMLMMTLNDPAYSMHEDSVAQLGGGSSIGGGILPHSCVSGMNLFSN